MSAYPVTVDDLSFIKSETEMGRLMRGRDWSRTPLGHPAGWPQSLRTLVAMLLENPVAMYIAWGSDCIQLYNDAFIFILGADKHPQALGSSSRETFAESWPTIAPLFRQVMEGAAVRNNDFIVALHPNGVAANHSFDFSYSPIQEEDGTAGGILVTAFETTAKKKTEDVLKKSGHVNLGVDITERKEMEDRLRESTQELQSVVASAPFPIGVYVGKDMIVKLANQSMLDVWDKGNQVVGKSYKELLPELGSSEIFQQIERVLETGEAFHARDQRVDIVVHDRLQSFYFNYSFTPLYDAAGKVYGVMNTGAEVTDLHLAKQKVEQSEWNFRNMILQAPVAMCILLGPDHVVEVANALMIELWGKPAADVLNKPIFEGLPDAKGQGLEQLMTDVFYKGETFSASERPVVLLRNGKEETVYQNFVYEPYLDADGAIQGVLAISVDVTAQVLARQKIEEVVAERTKELAATNQSLQKSNAELAQFAYIASHDLQEPLRKISTFSQMLENNLGAAIDEKVKHYLTKINQSSLRMHTLIRDVLTYSELVKEADVFSPVDLNSILEGILTDYELRIEQKDATILVEKLPTIDAIPLQMSQLFGNLVGNSLKFTRPDQKPVITIKTLQVSPEELEQASLPSDRAYSKIQLSDNGIGFKKEYAEQIFNIFQRLHRKSDCEGTGIGLALCKKIVLNHGGALNANGSSENGAVFNVILPLRQKGQEN